MYFVPLITFARPQSVFRLLSFALLLLGTSTLAFAQGGVGSSRGLSGSSSGSNIIKGRVHFPVEPQAGRHVRVRLTSTDLLNQSAVTDEDGSFSFNGLPAGHYTIIVEAGKEFDQAAEPVSIGRETSVGARNMNVDIHLKLKGTADAISKIPKQARELYSKGMEAAAKGDGKQATEQLSSAVALYPEFPQALGELGLQYLKLSQPDKAVEPLKKATGLSPKDFTMRLNYGIALLGNKNYGEAELQLREALKLNSAAPTAHMYLGITLLSLSRDEKTRQFNNADKYADAQKELETAISSGKDEVAQAHRYLGGIYWGNKDYKRAADEFEIYVKLVPKAGDAARIRDIIKELRSKQ